MYCTLLSVMVIYMAKKLAIAYSIVDHPGEHKQHDVSTPFVGGVGLLVVLFVALTMLADKYPDLIQQWFILGLCSIVIFITGFLDDFLRLDFKLRLIIQMIVATVMVFYGGIVLNDLGDLFFNQSVQLGVFAIPFTICAIIGGINIINMADGIDGLSGSLSLVSLLLIGIVALVAGNAPYVLLISALAGGAIGFLYFNLRYPSQNYARVFLGDNGSMLLGLLFAWLLVDLAQGANSAMTPVTALWLLSIPLMDAICVMQRRLRMGKSPFAPGHDHLHHILIKAGISIKDTVYVIVFLHLFFGTLGLSGLYLGVPDFVMMLGFILIYIGYYYLTSRPQSYVPIVCLLYARFKLTSIAGIGVFFGNYTNREAEKLSRIVSKDMRLDMDFCVQIYKQPNVRNNKCYAILLNIRFPKDAYTSDEKIKRDIALLQKRLVKSKRITLRQLTKRKSDIENCNDRRVRNYGSTIGGSRISERRVIDQYCLGSQLLAFEITRLSVNQAIEPVFEESITGF